MTDIFPPSIAFAGFCRKVKRTISLNHTECASKQMSEHRKVRSHKKRSLSPHSPSPSSSSSQYSSDTPSKTLANATAVGNKPRSSSPRHPAIVSSDHGSPAFRKSDNHNIDNGLTSNALISRVSVATTACPLPCASRRKRSGAPSSSSSPSPVDATTINTTISTTSKKPILFINNIAPVVPRPKPSTTVYVPSQSALQQKVRKRLREGDKIKRSSNCFIKYRTYMHPFIVAKYGNQNNKEISKLAGRSWRNEPEHVKAIYRQQASEEKQRHASLYPSYVYTPARQNQREDASSCAPDCPSAAKSPSPASATPPRSAPQNNSHTSDNPIESESSQEFVKRNKRSRRTQSSSSASERPISTEKPFVVTETPLHDFNGDSELAVQKRPSSKSCRHRGSSNVDEPKRSGSHLSKDSISFAKTIATTPPPSTLRSDPPSFEPLCHLITSTAVPVVCAIDLPSSQSTAHEEAWMALDLSQDFPNMSERSEELGSLFSSSLGYPLSLPQRMVAPDQVPILSTRSVYEPDHHHQPHPQHNNATRSVDILGQSFTFPQVEEFSATSLLTKPLLENSFHQSLSWELSGAVPRPLDTQTHDYSSASIDASVPLFSSHILPMAAAASTDLPQDFAIPGDAIKGEFSRLLWFTDATSAKEWPPTLFSLSPMAIAASKNVDPSSSSSPESSSSLLSSPGCGSQGDMISTSMAPPPPLPYDAFFDLIVPKVSPVNEWAVPGATSVLGDPMTGSFIASAAITNDTKTHINSSSKQNGGFCYINGSSSNYTGNNSMEDPRLIFQQPLYEDLQQQPSPARVDGGVHGCSDDELQRSIEFYEWVLEQQKLQLSMQRQIREQTQQHQLFSNDLCPQL